MFSVVQIWEYVMTTAVLGLFITYEVHKQNKQLRDMAEDQSDDNYLGTKDV